MRRLLWHKLLAVLLLLSLSLGMTACEKKRKKSTTTTTPAPTTTTPATSTTSAPTAFSTPAELVAAGMQSRGVYEICEASDLYERVYYLSVEDSGWIYFSEDGRYAYHDLTDCGYAVIDGEAYRLDGALYAEYSRLHDYFGRGENDVMKKLRRMTVLM